MQHKRQKVLVLLENGPFIADTRPKREVKALIEAGYQVSVICPAHKNARFHQIIDQVHIYCFPLSTHTGGILSYLIEYIYAIALMFIISLIVWFQQGFDIIHAHNPPDVIFVIAAFYKLFGKKFVFDHRDLSPELYQMRYNHKGTGLFYNFLLLFERLSCSLSDCVLATNISYQEIEKTRDHVPDSKIFIVRNGPDSETKPIEPDPELRQKAKIIIAYIGVMGPQDGVDYLLRALNYLDTDLNHSDFFCVLIGDGHAVNGLKTLARTLGLESRIWFTGWIMDRKKILSYLSTADICVQPDPSGPFNNVSTMIKTMEYMALSKPVVAYDLPETRFTGGDAISYAQPNNEYDFAVQISRLMDDSELRSRLGDLGRKRIIDGLTWEIAVNNLLKAYETLDI